MSPLDRGALFLAKTVFNCLLMMLVELVVMPLFWILFNLSNWNLLPKLFLVTLLGTIGFCVLGTIMSAITLRARARELLLPLVLFPLMIPVLLNLSYTLNNHSRTLRHTYTDRSREQN